MHFSPNVASEYPLAYYFTILTCLYVVAVIVKRAYFHPLSKYPGPKLGRFTDLPTILAVLQRRRTFKQHELLQRYGSPLRLGTNAILFSDLDSIAQILGQSSKPCLKDPASYDGLSATGEVNVLNATDRLHHGRLRRLVSHSFSLKALLEVESFLGDKIDEYLLAFKSQDGQSVDILERTYHLFLDIVSQLSFGESFDCLSGKSPNAHHDVRAFFTVVPPLSFAPPLKYLPIKAFREGLKALARLHEFSRAHVDAYTAGGGEKRDSGPRGQLLQNMAQAVDAETGTKLSREELVENAIIFLAAGSGTTAATTIYLIWECARHPQVRKRLIGEIRSTFPDPSVRPTYEEVAKLPFLDCLLKETLRLHGPLNSGAPRISPGKTIAGHYVPEGVKVEVNTYATARNPDVFPDPETFKPSRWENTTDAMNNMARPFSYGPRSCVGRHLAEIGLVMTVARLYQLYDVTLSLEMAHQDMSQTDLGVLEPACEKFCVTTIRASKANT